MSSNAYRGRTRSNWMAAGMVCGLVLALTAAAQAQERAVGTVVGVPLSQYGGFVARNAFPGLGPNFLPIPGNNTNFLHTSQFIAGSFNTAVVTAGVVQRNNSQPADRVYFPAPGATPGQAQVPAIYRDLNFSDIYTDQTVIGSGNTAVIAVDVQQQNSGSYVPGSTRFMKLPIGVLEPTRGANSGVNINQIHTQQTIIGNNNQAVAVVGVSQENASGLKVQGPTRDVLAASDININVIVTNQVLIGDGNTAVATVNVAQQNAPA